MKRNLLLLLAAPVVGYLAVKLYIHLQVGNTVELLIAQAEPMAAVSYGRVTSDVDGRVGLSDVVIRPSGLDDQIHVSEVSIQVPSLMYLLTLEQRVRSQELPESLSLKVHDVRVSTRGALAKAWEDAIYEDDPEGYQRAFDNCVTRTGLPSQMYLLHYDELRGSFELGYRYDPHLSHLVLHGRAGQIDGVSFEGDLALVLPAFDLHTVSQAFGNPEIARASMEITDSGYFQRVYAYCDQDGGMDREAVVTLMTANLLQMFDGLPMKPDEPLMTAYTSFVDSGTSMLITAEPREPKKLEYLSLYNPVDVPAVLNINARVQ